MDSYIARQPIFDRSNKLFGYELLYRTDYGGPVRSAVANSDATTEVILNSYIEIGLDRLVGEHLAFINAPSGFIFNNARLPPPSENIVLEIIKEDMACDEFLAGIRLLSELGYHIAFDDFDFNYLNNDLIKFAQYVKIDIKRHNTQELEQLLLALKKWSLKTIAIKVETFQEYKQCEKMGFDHYQGIFFSQPKSVHGKSISANQLMVMKLLEKLQNKDIEARELTRIIEADVALSLKLFRFANSASLALNHRVESIHHAIVTVGLDNVRLWANLIALTTFDDTPGEVIRVALVRAKMCELLIKSSDHRSAGSAFLVGLFSTLDAIIGMPLYEILPELQLNKDINNALLFNEGPFARVLKCVLAYERGEWKVVEPTGFAEKTSTDCYLRAVEWCDLTSQQIL